MKYHSMKNTALTAALSLALFACSTNTADNDLRKLNLHGAVKSILEETYLLSEDGQKGAKTMDNGFDHRKLFDKKGFLVRKDLFNPEGTPAGTYIYEYNAGHLLTKETKYTPTDNIDKVYTYSYNAHHQLETQTTHTALGNVEYLDKFTHPSPTLSVQECADAAGNPLYKWEYEYDAHNNMTRKTWYAFGNIVFNTFVYNDKNQLTEQTELTDSGATTRWQYTYDAQGNATSEVCTYPDGEQNTNLFEYEYDKRNNWTVKQVSGNGVPLYRVERTIEYNE